jgi:hypothetical protein
VPSLSLDIDPLSVLGVPADASLEQIRDAYRRKSKIHHPDAGGEEWAFRVLSQSYELLCTARVMRATRAESPAPRPGPEPVWARGTPTAERRRQASAESLRGGIHDQDIPPLRLVGVEHLCVRYLWEDAAYLYLTQKQPDEERFLSCSLNLNWPDQAAAPADRSPRDRDQILADLGEIFDHLVVSTRVVSSRSDGEDDRFSGWLSYSSFDLSWKAVKCLHDALRARGLGMRQWSRDLYIPRKWD